MKKYQIEVRMMNEQTKKLMEDLRVKLEYAHTPARSETMLMVILLTCKNAGLAFVETVTPPSLQDPGADTYPIVREIEL